MIKKICIVVLSIITLAVNSAAFAEVLHFYIQMMSHRTKDITVNFNVTKGNVTLDKALPAILAANSEPNEKYDMMIKWGDKNAASTIVFNKGKADECTYIFEHNSLLDIEHTEFCAYRRWSGNSIILVARNP
jgi:hypothetical protein